MENGTPISTKRRQLFPIVAADVALFTAVSGGLRVFLLLRDSEPQARTWALPGAVLDPDRDATIDDTARRALREKARIEVPYIEQVGVFSGANRDARGYSVSVAYCALLPLGEANVAAGAKSRRVLMPDPTRLHKQIGFGEPIAFDHRRIIECALNHLRQKVANLSLPLHLLPKEFTLAQLQAVCESVLGTKLDKSSFRRRLKAAKPLLILPGKFVRGPQRPAQLYRAPTGYRF